MRIITAMGWALIAANAISVADAGDLPQSLQHCRAEPDEVRRLACYDAIVVEAHEPAAIAGDRLKGDMPAMPLPAGLETVVIMDLAEHVHFGEFFEGELGDLAAGIAVRLLGAWDVVLVLRVAELAAGNPLGLVEDEGAGADELGDLGVGRPDAPANRPGRAGRRRSHDRGRSGPMAARRRPGP